MVSMKTAGVVATITAADGPKIAKKKFWFLSPQRPLDIDPTPH